MDKTNIAMLSGEHHTSPHYLPWSRHGIPARPMFPRPTNPQTAQRHPLPHFAHSKKVFFCAAEIKQTAQSSLTEPLSNLVARSPHATRPLGVATHKRARLYPRRSPVAATTKPIRLSTSRLREYSCVIVWHGSL